MPTYEYECLIHGEFEWEHSITKVEELCPQCKKEGKKTKIKKLISLCAGKVELSGNELKSHLMSEGNKLKRAIKKDENLAANIEGEASYNKRQLAIDRMKKL